ncbi:MAG TPA: TonB-dependent receptor plug domain-containing protein, partial [Longimicrobiales bacterium]|nr:TonB-dependent receptor plug domain-containing protein [Longimicrobiales bacterium]
MQPRAHPSLPVLLAALPALAAAQTGESARPAQAAADSLDLLGAVVDAETLAPLEDVAVTLQRQVEPGAATRRSLAVVSDLEGRFLFRDLEEGSYRIALERLGYGTVVDTVDYDPSLGLHVEVRLVPEAVELEPMLVAVEARARHLEAAGFYQRRAQGLGRFVTREDIEEQNVLEVTDLLRTMPGVTVRYGSGVFSEPLVLMRGGCLAKVYVDGVPTISPFSLDSMLQPGDVDAIEVYHASELPAQYNTSGCGAVL